jgi:charged multivesicular body protein 7
MDPVKSELQEEKVYVPLSQFLTAVQSIYDPGWLPYRIASYVIGKPLWWALQQTGVVGSGDVIESDTQRWKRVKGDYVLRDLVESAAQGVLAHQRTRETGTFADKLYTVESFKREFSGVALPDAVLSDLDMKVLLKHLERDMKAVVVDGKVTMQTHIQPPIANLRFHRLSSLSTKILNLEQSMPSTAACLSSRLPCRT